MTKLDVWKNYNPQTNMFNEGFLNSIKNNEELTNYARLLNIQEMTAYKSALLVYDELVNDYKTGMSRTELYEKASSVLKGSTLGSTMKALTAVERGGCNNIVLFKSAIHNDFRPRDKTYAVMKERKQYDFIRATENNLHKVLEFLKKYKYDFYYRIYSKHIEHNIKGSFKYDCYLVYDDGVVNPYSVEDFNKLFEIVKE